MKKTLILAATLVAASSFAGFTGGNLVVSVIDSGASPVAATAYKTLLREYTITGVQVGNDLLLPSANSASQNAITCISEETSELDLTLSENGQFLILGGYRAVPGTTSPGTFATRTIARVALDGTIDTSTQIPYGELPFTTDSFRSIWSTDGTKFWCSSGSGGQQYVTFGATSGSTTVVTSTDQTSAISSGRQLRAFGGNFYYSSSDDFTGGIANTVYTYPAYPTSSVTPIGLFGLAGSPRSLFIQDADTIYVASSTAAWSLTKFKRTAGIWAEAYRAGTGLGSLVGLTKLGNKFYGTNQAGTKVYEITDTGTTFTNNKIVDLAPNVGDVATKIIRGIVALPQTGSTVSGLVTLENFDGGNPANEKVTFEIVDAANTVLATIPNVALASNGAYTFSTTQTGTKFVRAKGRHWISQKIGPVTLGAGANFSLKNGDIDNDNAVTILDYSVLSDYFDVDSSFSGWNTVGGNGFKPSDADLDGDDAVTILDYSTLSDNFDIEGS